MGTAAWKHLPVLTAAVSAFNADSPESVWTVCFPCKKKYRGKGAIPQKIFSETKPVCRTVLQKKSIGCVALKMMGNFYPWKQLCGQNPLPGKSRLVLMSLDQIPAISLDTFHQYHNERASGLLINTALPLKWMFDNVSLITCSSFPSSNLGHSSWHLSSLQQHSKQQHFDSLLSKDRTAFVMDAWPVHWVT